MRKTLKDFASAHGLFLSEEQLTLLEKFVALVWQKKDFLNLTSAADTDEVFTRHICDGLAGAAKINALAQERGLQEFEAADAGAGAGYIGVVTAVALPQVRVTLIESIEKRCAFMNWALLNLGLKNGRVKNARLGQGTDFKFDFLTERAMGKLEDILGVCTGALKSGGTFIAYQAGKEEARTAPAAKYGAAFAGTEAYTLPRDEKTRYLALFTKN